MLFTRGERKTVMWSFDVYDTCLTRNYVHPKDVYREVALHKEIELESHLGAGWIEIFTDTRSQAQSVISEVKQGGEPSLIEIYKQVKNVLPFIKAKDYIASELLVEKESLCPCCKTRSLVKLAREKYGRVVFISDMYLPHKFIKDALIKHRFFSDADVLYVSSSYQQESKSNGKLFNRVLRDLNLKPSQLTHHGDNIWSDIRQARRLSIKPKHIKTCKLSKKEKAILESTSITSNFLASRLVGHIRAQRIGPQTSLNTNTINDFTNNFSGPFLWLFAEWILVKAIQHNSQEIYLCSRDCFGLMIILERLIKLKSVNLKLRYFAASRQALALATLKQNQKSLNLQDLQEAMNGLELKAVLRKIGIKENDFLQFTAKNGLQLTNLNTKLDTTSKWQTFWQCLKSPAINRHINEIAEREQGSAVQYFKDIRMLSRTRKTIVDFGWRQNCQSMMMDLLKDEINPDKIMFLYLGLADRRNLRAAPHRSEALFYGSESGNSNYTSNCISRLIDKTQLIEVLMSCDPSNSIRSYHTDTPQCQYTLTGELKLRKEMNLSIQRYANSINKGLPSNEHGFRLATIQLMNYWFENPKKKWRSLFKEVRTIKEAFRGSDTIIAEPLQFHYDHLRRRRLQPLIKGKRASGSRAWKNLALSNTSLIGYFLFLPASIASRVLFLYSRRIRIPRPSNHLLNATKNQIFALSPRLKKAISGTIKSIAFILTRDKT